MDPSSFSGTVRWILAHGYLFLFVLMFIEGPAVTAAGAFAAALGYLDLLTVFILSILGNLIPDIVYYAIGFWGGVKFIEKYGHYFGLTEERVRHTRELINGHAGKAMTAIKLIPLLATPGLIMTGAMKMDLKKYIWWSLGITIPSSLVYLVIGYYFGAAYEKINRYIDWGGYLLVGIMVIFLIISYLHKRFAHRLVEKIHKP